MEETLSPKKTLEPKAIEGSPHKKSLYRGNTEQEVVATLATLGTLVKNKRKRQRQGPLYFKTRKRTKIKQGIPKTL